MREIPTITIAVLSYPGAQSAAVHGLMDLFQTADRLHQRAGGVQNCRLNTCLLEALPARPDANISALIIPPSLSGDVLASVENYASGLQAFHAEGAQMCSVCAGAFLLAGAGLLDGRTATTHWDLAAEFSERFPAVMLDTNQMIIDDGDIITAGGVMAWIDLGLRIVDRYLGSAIMLETARFLLVDPGGREQRFYSVFSPSRTHGDTAVVKVQKWLQEHHGEPVTVQKMAARSGLSGRTFIRRFQKATGFSPSEYLQQLRVSKARELMETTRMSVEEISWRVGYQDAGAFRRIFHKVMGLTPREYRSRFSTVSNP